MPSTSTPSDPSNFDAPSYWEKRLKANPGLLGVGYTKLGTRYNDALYQLRSEVFRQLLADLRIDAKACDVLDIGSGTGHYIREWRHAGARSVTGSDLTEVAVGRLREAFPGVTVQRFDVTDPQRPAALTQYDVVSAFDMLFHIVDDARYEQAIKNCFALVKPGGHFIFSESLPHRERHAVPHMVSRTLGEVEELLDRAGFVVVDRRPMFVLMNYPVDGGALARLAWTAMAGPCVFSELYGGLLGKALLPLERRLVRNRVESPSTEIVVCRRREDVAGAGRRA